MTRINPKIDALLNNAKWHEERKRLREIVLDCGLREDVKWGKLCYCFENSNAVMIFSRKEDCALGFFKGALLKDAEGILEKPGENSQAMRWGKFTSTDGIARMEPVLKAYIEEAVGLEEAGARIDFKEKDNLVLAGELQEKLDADVAFRAAFKALTPGRQRGYNLYFSAAKQPKTRLSRIEKLTPNILAGKGMNDR